MWRLRRAGGSASVANGLRVSPDHPSLPGRFSPLSADCFTCRLHLHAFVDGELDTDIPGSALRELVFAHLRECARCQRVERQLRAMREALLRHARRSAELDGERASAEFHARMARLLAG